MVPLISLSPVFFGAGGPGITDKDGNPVPERHGVALGFNCPCGCGALQVVELANPLDGGPIHNPNRPVWTRTGESFEVLTLSPSILSDPEKGGCGWHGFVGGASQEHPGYVVTI